jgi:hypothetical protein
MGPMTAWMMDVQRVGPNGADRETNVSAGGGWSEFFPQPRFVEMAVGFEGRKS